MKDTLMGRPIGIVIADGLDGAVIKRIKRAATELVLLITAPKVGGAKIANDAMLATDGQQRRASK